MHYITQTFEEYPYFYSWLGYNMRRDGKGTLEPGARDYNAYVTAMEGYSLRARFIGLPQELPHMSGSEGVHDLGQGKGRVRRQMLQSDATEARNPMKRKFDK